jgi:hypothetical protein
MPRPAASVRLSVFMPRSASSLSNAIFSREVPEDDAPDRRALNDRDRGELSFRRQSELLGIAALVSIGPPPAAN